MFVCFKQKTAYEMGICDWCSDVCSSDLGEAVDTAPIGKPFVRQSVPSTEAVRALDDTDVETGIKPDATHARRLIQGDEAPDLLLLRAIVDPLPRFGCVVTAIEDRKSTRLNYSH